MTAKSIGERQRFGLNDWLLTLLSGLLALIVFVFAPLQATGDDWVWRCRSRPPLGKKSLQHRSHRWATVSGNAPGEAGYSRGRGAKPIGYGSQ
jgi:hypothetical protein